MMKLYNPEDPERGKNATPSGMINTEEDLEAAKTKARENQQALVFMDCWGSGEEIDDEPFHGYAYVIRDYAPDFVNNELPERCQHTFTDTVTVLSTGLSSKSPADIEGYTEVYRYPAGEKECPGLHDEEHSTQEGGCPFCEGNDYIYWGDDWEVHVLVADETEDDDDD